MQHFLIVLQVAQLIKIIEHAILVRLKNPHAQHVVMFLRLYLNTRLKSRWQSHEFGEMPPPLVVDS